MKPIRFYLALNHRTGELVARPTKAQAEKLCREIVLETGYAELWAMTTLEARPADVLARAFNRQTPSRRLAVYTADLYGNGKHKNVRVTKAG